MPPDSRVREPAPDVAAIGRASRWVPARVDQPELLDLGGAAPADVAQSFADLWRINRYLGGISALTRSLYPRLLALDTPVTVADLGAGSGQIAASIAAWARAHRRKVRVLALDRSADYLALASRAAVGVTPVQADATALPFANEGIDYVISSLFLHHFAPEQVIALLRSAYARSRHGIVMCDLTRGWIPLALFKLGQPIFARSPITRYDGAVSIRRGYTPAELTEMARAAGLPDPRVTTHWAWRMTLVADK